MLISQLGDDGMSGNATSYAVKYSTLGPVNASNWDSATSCLQFWTPTKNGTGETHIVYLYLSPGTTYWFAVEACDASGNYGGVSNSVSAATSSPGGGSDGGGGTEQGFPVMIVAGVVTVVAIVAMISIVASWRGRNESHHLN